MHDAFCQLGARIGAVTVADAPTRAMVLAAGLGTRMRPLTLTRPKPLLEVAGRTMLDHALDRLAAAGITDAVVNCHYLGEMIRDHVTKRPPPPRITLSEEPEVLDTGGGVRRALPWLGEAPIFVMNSDVVWRDGAVPALDRMAAAWDGERMDALLLMVPHARAVGHSGAGDGSLVGDDEAAARLLRLRAAGSSSAPLVYMGTQIVEPTLYREAPDGAFSNRWIWDRAAVTGRLFGLVHDGVWFHVGTPDALAETDAALRP